jgi:hypothetical protein
VTFQPLIAGCAVCKDSEALEVLTKTAQNFVQLYVTGKVSGITAIVEAPTRAYLGAIGAE